MQDARLKLYSSYAYKTFDNTGAITSDSASAAVTNSASNTGFVRISNTNRVPRRPLVLDILMPGTTLTSGVHTSTGASGSATITFVVTFSDDGSAAAGESITLKVSPTATFASSSAPALGQLQYHLPPVNHAYIKVAWTTQMTTVTGVTWGLVDISLIPGEESVAIAGNSGDLG